MARALPCHGSGRGFESRLFRQFCSIKFYNAQLAQLVARFVDIEEVTGSNPVLSTRLWGISSAGRAAPLQGVGQRFDPVILHQILLTKYRRVCHDK
jgi:hypothetical protein